MKRTTIVFLLLVVFTAAFSQEKQNVLFIAVDDLKPLLGAYGDKTAITPNFDRLAAMGTTFTNAQCQQAVCGPSRASLLTGLYPDLTEVWDLKTQIRDKNPNILTLPQHFSQNGYETFGTGKIFDPRSVDNGLDEISWSQPYVMPKVPDDDMGAVLGTYFSDENKEAFRKLQEEAQSRRMEGVKLNNFLRERFKPSTESADVADEEYFDGMATTIAIDKLNEFSKSQKPFFLALGFKKPHLPFVAPKKYWDLYDRDNIPLAEFQKRAKGTTELPYHDFGELRSYTDIPEFIDARDHVREEKQRELIHGYYACVSYIDALLGKVLDALEANKQNENTTIVLWGDHGWHLGDHGLWAKHSNFEQATRAPLIFVDPSMKKGQTNDSPVNFVDIFPTLCDLAGITKPDHLQGISLSPILSGKQSSVNEFAISQFGRGQTEGYALRNDRYRYVAWFKDGNTNADATILAKELYDYKKDPLETESIIASERELGDQLHSQLMAFLAQLNADKVAFKKSMKGTSKSVEIKPIAIESNESNLLKNPGFEDGNKGWITFGDVEAEFVNVNAHRGTGAVLLPKTRIGIMQKVELKPNTEYVLSAWIKSSNGEAVILNVKGHGSDEVKEQYAGNEYGQVSLRFTTGNNPSEVKIRVMKFNKSHSSDAWADDFELREAAPPKVGLREILDGKFGGEFYLGATIASKQLGGIEEKLLIANFNYTVSENAVKQTTVHPEPGVWDWSKFDPILKMAEKNDIMVRLHGPISPQASKWARNDSRKGAELEKNMTEYMTEQCKRYNGHPNIKWMDVVNETVERDGSWFGPKPGEEDWENPWTIIGSDSDKNKTPIYISRAFEIANKYAPTISLVYNQHGGMEPEMWERVKETILYLKAKGLKVDGVGWQAHINSDEELPFDPKQLDYLSALIDWAHANELDFHVTEIDYRIQEEATDEYLKKQADAYANILKVLLSKRSSGVVTYNTWGLTDGSGRHADKARFMFSQEGEPKPAFYAIKEALENPESPLVVKQAKSLMDENFDNGELRGNWISFGDTKPAPVSGKGVGGTAAVGILGDKSGIKYSLSELESNSSYKVEVWINATPEMKMAFKIKGLPDEPTTSVNRTGQYRKDILEFTTGARFTDAELIINRWETGMEGYVYVDNVSIVKIENR